MRFSNSSGVGVIVLVSSAVFASCTGDDPESPNLLGTAGNQSAGASGAAGSETRADAGAPNAGSGGDAAQAGGNAAGAGGAVEAGGGAGAGGESAGATGETAGAGGSAGDSGAAGGTAGEAGGGGAPQTTIKNWIAFRRQDPTQGDPKFHAMLYVVDPASSKPPVLLSAGLGPTQEVFPDYAFSPNGKHIAYLAESDPNRDRMYQLYVADVSGETPAKPVQVSQSDNDVKAFTWSQDGTRIAWRATWKITGETFGQLGWAEVNGPNVTVKNAVPGVTKVGTVAHVYWVGNDTLTFSAQSNQFAFTSLKDGEFGPVTSLNLTIAKANIRSAHDLRVSVVGINAHPYSNTHYVDLRTSTEKILDPSSFAAPFSPDAQWVAHCASFDPKAPVEIWQYSALGTEDGKPLAPLSTSNCKTIAWAKTSAKLASVDDLGKVRLTSLATGKEPESTLLAGSYLPPEEVLFSVGDRWLASRHRNSISVSRLKDTGPTSLERASGTIPSATTEIAKFAPTAQKLLFQGHQQSQLKELYLIDLETDTPSAQRKLNPESDVALASMRLPAWSPDSAWIAYLYSKDNKHGAELHVVDVNSPAAVGKIRSSDQSPECEDPIGQDCAKVLDFSFRN